MKIFGLAPGLKASISTAMLILGHKNPDTDSVVSALVLAQLAQKKALFGGKVSAGRAGEINNETKFVLDYFKVKAPGLIKSIKGKEVFLVDHNSSAEAAEGKEESILLGVLDHHLLSGVSTASPVYYRCETVGSTSTLVAKMFEENGVKPSKLQAKLLLAGILSDTLNLTSPTATKEDKRVVGKLQKISGLKIGEFVEKMFEAKSSLVGVKLEEVIGKDYKNFEFGKIKLGFGVWETVKPQTLLDKKEQLIEFLRKSKQKSRLDFVFFAIVDIIKNQSYWVISGDEEKQVVEQVFGARIKDKLAFMPGIVSRKKQMIPPLAGYFEKLN